MLIRLSIRRHDQWLNVSMDMEFDIGFIERKMHEYDELLIVKRCLFLIRMCDCVVYAAKLHLSLIAFEHLFVELFQKFVCRIIKWGCLKKVVSHVSFPSGMGLEQTVLPAIASIDRR